MAQWLLAVRCCHSASTPCPLSWELVTNHMQVSSLLMCEGEITKTITNNGLLPLLDLEMHVWSVGWFPAGSVGDSVLKCLHVGAGDYFLCWHSIYFTAFSLKTGLVLFSD